MPLNNIDKNIITVRGRERSLTSKQKELFANLKEYEINVSSLKDSNFLKGKNLFLEIGFGSGEIIYKQAKLNPNSIYIGIEYYKKGITQLIEKIVENKIDNLKIFHGDARRILMDIPSNIFDEIWLFFPDPWPKNRHEKRRFVQSSMIQTLNSKIKKGGRLLISSDDKNYIAWTLSLFLMENSFDWIADGPNDWQAPTNDYFGSRYENKGIKNDREPYFLKFKKL